MQILQESAEPDPSPGLDQFRRNPFRVLRLAPSATSQQALWQGEKILARVRAGIALSDAEVIPWLAAPGELEIRDGIQALEDPLARMVEQLLWFDFDHDPRGRELRAALCAGDGAGLRAHLDGKLEDPSFAERLNLVNVRLLVAFSSLRDVGPTVVAATAPAPARAQWERAGSLSIVVDPHDLARGRHKGVWVGLLADALLAWSRLLRDPAMLEIVRARLEDLDDDRVGPDDAEAVISAIWVRLADLVVGEAKVELQRGRTENVSHLARLGSTSEIDAAIWHPAFKPLAAQFRAELAALRPDASTGDGVLADISRYLDRLAVLIARWKKIDGSRLLGLAGLIDEALAAAFARLRAVEGDDRGTARHLDVCERVQMLSMSRSLSERVAGDIAKLLRELGNPSTLAARSCHYCRARKGERQHAAALVARGKQQLRAWPIARCASCARRHRQLINVSRAVLAATLLSLVLFVAFTPMSTGAAVGLTALGGCGAALVWWATRRIASFRMTPSGHRRHDDYHDSETAFAARRDGSLALTEPVYDDSPDAWAHVDRFWAAATPVAIAETIGDAWFVGLARMFGRPTARVVTQTVRLTAAMTVIAVKVAFVIFLFGIGGRFFRGLLDDDPPPAK